MEITFMRVTGGVDLSPHSLIKKMDAHHYEDSIGVGFKELDLEVDRFVSGFAVKKTPTFIKYFDPITGGMEERKDFIISEIYFKVDCHLQILQIYSGQRDVKRLLEVFNNTLKGEVNLEMVHTLPHRILMSMRKSSRKYEIKKLDIRDFPAEKGVVGNYNVKSIQPDLAWRFVEQYTGQIRAATVSFTDIEIEAVINIFQNGKFRLITRPRAAIDSMIEIIKTFAKELK